MNDKPIAGPELSKLVSAANMKRLYWIDDEFGASAVLVAQRLRNKIEILWSLAQNEVLVHPLLKAIVPGSAADFIESTLTKLLTEGKASDISRELIEIVDTQIAEYDATHQVGVKDLSPQQFDEIVEAFKEASASVERLSLSQWFDKIDTIRSEIGPDCVFFIDHDFSREVGGTATTGEEILKTVLAFEKQTIHVHTIYARHCA